MIAKRIIKQVDLFSNIQLPNVGNLPIDNGRYGTKEMMDIFSEQKKVDYQLEIEGAAAISQSEIGMISKK